MKGAQGEGPLWPSPSRKMVLAWIALAILNLSVGVWVALEPGRRSDLDNVIRWESDWLHHGANVYDTSDYLVAYPPHAVVLMSPLAAVPSDAALSLWIAVNIALVFASAYAAARFLRPAGQLKQIVLPILMFATWWGAHSFVQFSLLALAFSMAALMFEERPVAAGICLGMALMKPQIGLPVFLWALFTRRWRLLIVSLATVVTGFVVFCVRAAASPAVVVARYLDVLRTYYTGETTLFGSAQLRPLFALVISNLTVVDVVASSVSLVVLILICVAGFREAKKSDRAICAAPPLAACWSLLTFYSLSYGFVVLLPVLMLLTLGEFEQTTMLQRNTFWVLQLGMMIDVPGVARRTGLMTFSPLGPLLSHVDRLLVIAIAAGLVVLTTKTRRKN